MLRKSTSTYRHTISQTGHNMNTTFMHTDRDIFYTEKVTAFSSSKLLKLEVLH